MIRLPIRTAQLFALLLVPLYTAFAEGDAEQPSAADLRPPRIEYFEGEVWIDGEEAEFGQVLEVGALVQTGEGSYCEIEFGQANVLRITENTVAEVEIDYSSQNIGLKFGAVAAVFDKVRSVTEGGAFRVATPSAVAGVRGTVFYIRAESADSSYICTCNGTLFLEHSDGETTLSVTGTHHSARRFTRTDGEIVESVAGLEFHDDLFMEELAADVDVVITWE